MAKSPKDRREKRLAISVTREQFLRVRAEAAAQGIPVSEFVSQRFLAHWEQHAAGRTTANP